MMGAGYTAVPLDELFYNKLVGTQLKFVWMPVKCNISGKSMWLEFAYKLTALYTGPGDPLFEYKWHDKHEHLIWKLKR
jgi:hypothetical protein